MMMRDDDAHAAVAAMSEGQFSGSSGYSSDGESSVDLVA
jgi:hypothetical protein